MVFAPCKLDNGVLGLFLVIPNTKTSAKMVINQMEMNSSKMKHASVTACCRHMSSDNLNIP